MPRHRDRGHASISTEGLEKITPVAVWHNEVADDDVTLVTQRHPYGVAAAEGGMYVIAFRAEQPGKQFHRDPVIIDHKNRVLGAAHNFTLADRH